MTFRSSVLKKTVPVLASLSHSLLELELEEYQNIIPTDPRLRSFRLIITNEIDYSEIAYCAHRLTLHSNFHLGFHPKCDVSGVYFPRLKHLSLRRYTFELYLADCHILFEVAILNLGNKILDNEDFRRNGKYVDHWCASYSIRWHHYFRAFNELLPRLRQFMYTQGPFPIDADDMDARIYCDSFHGEQITDRLRSDGDREFGKVVEPSEEDRAALKELMARVEQS
ncbi:hypothetical protein BDV19DRAFT_399353 [Aspergillus venezuelensis]